MCRFGLRKINGEVIVNPRERVHQPREGGEDDVEGLAGFLRDLAGVEIAVFLDLVESRLLEAGAVGEARRYALSDVVGEGLRALVLVVDAVERFRVLGLGLHAGNASASKGFVTAGRWLPRVRFVVRLARNFTRRSIDRFCAAISLFASRRMLRGMSLMSFRAST